MKRPADIARATTRYNFHSHTQWCDGKAPIAEMTLAAIDAGMDHWGFTPHSPVPIHSSCNMSHESVAEYLAEVKRLQALHADRIHLYAAMEIDYLGPEWGPASDYFRHLPLDYRIGSVHFVPSDSGYVDVDGRFESFREKMSTYFHDDIRYVVNTFYDQSERMILEGGFDIIGHFDKIGHNASMFRPGIEDESWYRARIDSLIDLIIDSGITVEINTKIHETAERIFPACRWLDRLIASHTPIVVNSDAHVPDKIDSGRKYGIELLSRLEKLHNIDPTTPPCQ